MVPLCLPSNTRTSKYICFHYFLFRFVCFYMAWSESLPRLPQCSTEKAPKGTLTHLLPPPSKAQCSPESLKSLQRNPWMPQARPCPPQADVPPSHPSGPRSPAELLHSQQGKKRDIFRGKWSCLLYFSMWDGLHLEMFAVTRVTGLDTSSLRKADQFWSAHKGSRSSITAGKYKAVRFPGLLLDLRAREIWVGNVITSAVERYTFWVGFWGFFG